MMDYGKKIQPIVHKLTSGVSSWAQVLMYEPEGILIAEYDPCATVRWDDAVMVYTLYGMDGLPAEGFHFLPTTWIDTLQQDEDVDVAVQMRAFGKVKYA